MIIPPKPEGIPNLNLKKNIASTTPTMTQNGQVENPEVEVTGSDSDSTFRIIRGLASSDSDFIPGSTVMKSKSPVPVSVSLSENDVSPVLVLVPLPEKKSEVGSYP